MSIEKLDFQDQYSDNTGSLSLLSLVGDDRGGTKITSSVSLDPGCYGLPKFDAIPMGATLGTRALREPQLDGRLALSDDSKGTPRSPFFDSGAKVERDSKGRIESFKGDRYSYNIDRNETGDIVKLTYRSKDGKESTLQRLGQSDFWHSKGDFPLSVMPKPGEKGEHVTLCKVVDNNKGVKLTMEQSSIELRQNGESDRTNDTLSREGRMSSDDLRSLAKSAIKDEKTLAKFEQHLAQFDRRRGLSEEERDKTRFQIGRLLTGNSETLKLGPYDPSILTANDYWRLATQGLKECADPHSVSQGAKETCGPGAIQKMMLIREPSKAVAFVADLALTKQFKPGEGWEIHLGHKSLTADSEAKPLDTKEGQRSHFSQVFQIGSANFNLAGFTPDKKDVDRARHYGKHHSGDEGSIDFQHGKVREDHPFFIGQLAERVYKKISGSSPDTVCLTALGNKEDKKSPGLKYVGSVDELRTELQKLKEKDGLPVTVGIKSGADEDSGHLVTITGYEGGRVSIGNTWTKKYDSRDDRGCSPPLTVDQLFTMMKFEGPGYQAICKENYYQQRLTEERRSGVHIPDHLKDAIKDLPPVAKEMVEKHWRETGLKDRLAIEEQYHNESMAPFVAFVIKHKELSLRTKRGG